MTWNTYCIQTNISESRQIQEMILKKSIVDAMIPEKSVKEEILAMNVPDFDAYEKEHPLGDKLRLTTRDKAKILRPVLGKDFNTV